MEEDPTELSGDTGTKSPFPQEHSMMPGNSYCLDCLLRGFEALRKMDILKAMFALNETSTF